MAQETPALKVVSLGPEDDKVNNKTVDYTKSRRNPLLRYDQMFVSTGLTLRVARELRLIPREDMTCMYPRIQTGYGVVV